MDFSLTLLCRVSKEEYVLNSSHFSCSRDLFGSILSPAGHRVLKPTPDLTILLREREPNRHFRKRTAESEGGEKGRERGKQFWGTDEKIFCRGK
ncbi:hypothetical protein TNCV_4293911 [Trichonephila clavipes]|uniref:Uncharacterized protein n=1 Tax=Trichonephila clavipes TaxID=2585209 RepID=A0A8X6RFL1_TRICX|nr:hypothetical protein TNCV_4293911 [Trichonephila clavipes]